MEYWNESLSFDHTGKPNDSLSIAEKLAAEKAAAEPAKPLLQLEPDGTVTPLLPDGTAANGKEIPRPKMVTGPSDGWKVKDKNAFDKYGTQDDEGKTHPLTGVAKGKIYFKPLDDSSAPWEGAGTADIKFAPSMGSPFPDDSEKQVVWNETASPPKGIKPPSWVEHMFTGTVKPAPVTPEPVSAWTPLGNDPMTQVELFWLDTIGQWVSQGFAYHLTFTQEVPDYEEIATSPFTWEVKPAVVKSTMNMKMHNGAEFTLVYPGSGGFYKVEVTKTLKGKKHVSTLTFN